MTALSIASKTRDGSTETGTTTVADMVAPDADADERAGDIEVITKIDGDGKETVEKGNEVFVFPVT